MSELLPANVMEPVLRSRPVRAAVAAMALVALTAGCAQGRSPSPEGRSPGSSASAGSPSVGPTRSPEVVCQLPGASTNEAFIRRADNRDSYLQMSRLVGRAPEVGAHNVDGKCFERVVFPFEGRLYGPDRGPGFHARYIDRPTEDGSGLPVAVPGEVYIQLTAGAWTYGHQGGSGPRQLTKDQLQTVESIEQVVMTGNNEGMTNWTIGLDEKREFVLRQVSGTTNCPVMCAVLDVETK